MVADPDVLPGLSGHAQQHRRARRSRSQLREQPELGLGSHHATAGVDPGQDGGLDQDALLTAAADRGVRFRAATGAGRWPGAPPIHTEGTLWLPNRLPLTPPTQLTGASWSCWRWPCSSWWWTPR